MKSILSENKVASKKLKQDRAAKTISSSFSWLFSLLFIALIGFIIYASLPGFEHYGFKNIIFSLDFNLADKKASVWLPLCVTILTAGLAITIAGPIGLKTAVFIKYRTPPKLQKILRISIELLADIPSVIFGLFASQALGKIVQTIFHVDSSYSLITASFMLTFMILPTIVSLSLNAMDGIDYALLTSAMVMGNTKTKAIYKVCRRECRNGNTVALIIALSRAIGETMAISMILQSQTYDNTFDAGLWNILGSGLRSLGALISANMFAEGGGPALQGLLFAFGIIMFIFVIILNAIAMRLTKSKVNKKYTWWNKITNGIGNFVYFIPNSIKKSWEKITYKGGKLNTDNINNYISTRIKKKKLLNLYEGWKLFWEYFSVIVTIFFLFWIMQNILIQGGFGITSDYATFFSFSKDSTGQAFMNTILIIVIAVSLGLPLALMIAIYLNEFAREGKIKKVILFFIDSLGATPSILFGMFGLIFFIQALGWTSQGSAGKSLIAGTLTILIVILPVFIRTIQQALQAVPNDLRTNSYALGAGKWETIRKVVLPIARQAIMTTLVLVIGRILAETAPLYLTSGLASSSHIALSSEGQTLTTRIYAQIYEAKIIKGTSIMYECAFVTVLLVLIIITIVHVIIPRYYKHKTEVERDRYNAIKTKTLIRKERISLSLKKAKNRLIRNLYNINNYNSFYKQNKNYQYRKW